MNPLGKEESVDPVGWPILGLNDRQWQVGNAALWLGLCCCCYPLCILRCPRLAGVPSLAVIGNPPCEQRVRPNTAAFWRAPWLDEARQARRGAKGSMEIRGRDGLFSCLYWRSSSLSLRHAAAPCRNACFFQGTLSPVATPRTLTAQMSRTVWMWAKTVARKRA